MNFWTTTTTTSTATTKMFLGRKKNAIRDCIAFVRGVVAKMQITCHFIYCSFGERESEEIENGWFCMNLINSNTKKLYRTFQYY
jgi:hypothetical protein